MIDWLIDDHLYSAILRSLEQTHCARLWFYMSDYLFIARFLNIHRSGVLKRWHGWCHLKLQPSRRKFCVNHAPCHFMQSHIRNGVCVFSCNLPPALLAEWLGSFTCYCGNTGVERIPKLESQTIVQSQTVPLTSKCWVVQHTWPKWQINWYKCAKIMPGVMMSW